MRTLLAASLLALSLPLAAQPYGASNTEGLLLQIGLDGQGLVIDDDGSDVEVEGGTISLRAGYGFSPVFTLYAGAAGGRRTSSAAAQRRRSSALLAMTAGMRAGASRSTGGTRSTSARARSAAGST